MAARIWTLEQRQLQAEAIRRWQPWRRSTGPRTAQGKAKVSGNAYNGNQWANLRQAIKALNQALREQKDRLRKYFPTLHKLTTESSLLKCCV